MSDVVIDFYCCAGGMTRGLQDAGFFVVGVDIVPRPKYVGDEFVLGDALEVGPELIEKWKPALVAGSPPCQGYTALKAVHGYEHPMLIPQTREMFERGGTPYIIENVAGAPLRKDIRLCGEMFGLGVLQHRFFELGGWETVQPKHLPHRGRVRGWRHGEWFDGPYVAVYGAGGGKASVAEAQQAKGIDWTDDPVELAEALPPAYGEWLGDAFRAWRAERRT